MVALPARLAVEARLQLRTQASACVSPQVVIQSHILALTADDLRERVEAELHENPALEMVDDVHYLPAPPVSLPLAGAPPEALAGLRAPHTLADDIRLQLAPLSPRLRRVCDYLTDCLDDRGFLDADLGDVARALRAPLADVEAALATLQSLEPAGVGARDLRECLLLQIERLPAKRVPPRAADFIAAFLRPGRLGTPVQVGESLGLTTPELGQIVEFIGRKLHMWPADCFPECRDPGAVQAVLPDAAIAWEGDDLRVRVVQSWSRNLRVGEAWSRLDCQMRAAAGVVDERVAESVRRARAFIDFLTRREVMLKRITDAIVQRQREFFSHGHQALVPLTRKEIAAHIGAHESTVSRATAGKHVQLPNMQLVPYDFFFDGSVSAKSVLRSLIEREAPHQPLSDAVLAERLDAAGYPLARRTVGKYRDQLGIPGVHQRRAAALLAPRPSGSDAAAAVESGGGVTATTPCATSGTPIAE